MVKISIEGKMLSANHSKNRKTIIDRKSGAFDGKWLLESEWPFETILQRQTCGGQSGARPPIQSIALMETACAAATWAARVRGPFLRFATRVD
jgi:hypothetical protein